jgi:hypothetical protein
MALLKGNSIVSGALTVEGPIVAESFAAPDGATNVLVLSSLSAKANVLAKFESNANARLVKSLISDNGTITTVAGPLVANTYNKVAITAPANGSTLTIADGKTLTVSRTLQLTADADTRVLTLNGASKTLSGTGTTFSLGVATLTVTGTTAATIAFSTASTTLTVTDTASVSGTNTGDQTTFLSTASTSLAYLIGSPSATTSTDGLTKRSSCYLDANGYLYATRVYNAVWNDIADFITVEDDCEIEYGKAYCYDGKRHFKSTKYAQKGAIGIASDTYGFGVGQKHKGKEIPIAIGGFVLASCDKAYASGTPLTTYKDGMLTRAFMLTRLFHPERIIGTFYKMEHQKVWNGTIQVDGRHWIKIA